MSDINKLKELALNATPGPWSIDGAGKYINSAADHEGYLGGAICEVRSPLAYSIMDPRTEKTRMATGLYIAHANPTVVLDLIAQRDELLAALTLARDMFIANGFDVNLPNTFETMQDVIAKVQS